MKRFERAGGRRIVVSEFEIGQLEERRAELDTQFKSRTAQAVHVASRQRIYGKDRT